MEKNKQITSPELPSALRKPRLRRWEASEYLLLAHGITVAPSTLAKYVSVGGGPKYQKFNSNGTPLYPKEELDLWARERLGEPIRHSSDAQASHNGAG